MQPHGIKVTAMIPGAAYTDSWKASGLPETRFMEAEDMQRPFIMLRFSTAGYSRRNYYSSAIGRFIAADQFK
jgi:short-subunit dehydrogenase